MVFGPRPNTQYSMTPIGGNIPDSLLHFLEAPHIEASYMSPLFQCDHLIDIHVCIPMMTICHLRRKRNRRGSSGGG
jgi:hypothetical protein